MKRIARVGVSILIGGIVAAEAQSSSVLKSVSKYLPSLSEIGFVTGAINCYVQTATLVRAVNKEIQLAKSMSKRLDDLKSQTEQMVGQFGSLAEINPYEMDSWAAWLNRAEGLVSEETNDFVDILFNSVLKTLDDRMTVGFYSQVKRGLSYDASQGRIGEVLRAYYVGREYDANREKIRTASINAKRLSLFFKQGNLMRLQATLSNTPDAETRAIYTKRIQTTEAEIRQLDEEIRDPAIGGTATDKQIAFLMDMAQNLAQEISESGQQLEKHQADLIALNQEWALASKDKLPKTKNRTVQNTSFPISRDLYGATDADKVPSPLNDVDRPTKQNTSETSSPTNVSDLFNLQNKIELKRLEIMEAGLNTELQVAQCQATVLAVNAYRVEEQRNRRSTVTFEAENLEQVMESAHAR
jgi:hypothetical protein